MINEMILRLKESLGDRFENYFKMEDEILSELEILKKLKDENPDVDLNYVVTGKRTDVIMKGEYNFTGCKIRDNRTHYQGCLILSGDLKQITQSTPEETETLNDFLKKINIHSE